MGRWKQEREASAFFDSLRARDQSREFSMVMGVLWATAGLTRQRLIALDAPESVLPPEVPPPPLDNWEVLALLDCAREMWHRAAEVLHLDLAEKAAGDA